ncbi:hypothetical protein ACI65C_010787 [Semiaphis heraclei]
MNETHSHIFQHFFKELKSDKTIDSWLFVNSPWPVCSILALYLTFVFKLGPKLMKNREPMNIKYMVLLYNLMQTVFNSYILAYQLIRPEVFNYLWNHSCHPDSTKSNIAHEIHIASWYFAFSKILDLLDTVFFVLKKKQSHISFLHVYHHVNMVITCFAHLRFIKNKNVDSWMLMSTPWPVLSILIAYLLFVLKIGPKMMENREPFKIKRIMMAYNILQTIYNIFIVSEVFITPGLYTYLLMNVCSPDESESNSRIINVFYAQSWHYVVSKIFDLLDTVFFVLRKKQSHISFLHVYHHVNMVVTSWTFLRFIKGQQGAICGVFNAMIHSIMYSYYFLSALGPHMQKYLWWKKYLTRLQIVSRN